MLPPGVLFKVHVPVDGRPFSTIEPVGSAHDGLVMVPTVGAAGVSGRGFIVTVAGFEMHVLSDVLLTRISWSPGKMPANVADGWYDPLSILYSNSEPRGELTTIVPVATVQVGCAVTIATGVGGGVG